jgi:translocation and assembly module TamA
LEPFGYYAAQVTTNLEGIGPSRYLLLVMVAPGEPTRLATVDVEVVGAGATDAAILAKVADFPLASGDPLLHQQYEAARDALVATARGRGYLDAFFSVHQILVDPEKSTARIHLVLETGSRYQFGAVTFEGTTLYPEELLRRYIPFVAGETFSYATLGRAQLNFASSGYFKNVSVIPNKEQAVNFKVPVTVMLTPAPRRVLRPGAGYGTDTGFRGSLNYRDLNVLFPGNILNVETTVSQRFQGIGAAYSIPSDHNIRSVSTIQANVQREQVNNTESKLAMLDVSRSVGLGDRSLGTAYIRYLHEIYTTGLQDSTSNLLLPGLRFLQNRYDDLINPTAGYHYSLEVRGTHQALGSDAGFIQLLADGGVVTPLPWQLSLQTRSRLGYSILNDPLASLPASLRFFAGGDNSVRGYGYKSLAPKDASGAVIGGKYLLQGSIELERALFEQWGVSIFFDAGNAFDSFSNLKLYEGAGVAAHYHTKIGSVSLGLARQINVPDPGYRVHFTIGFQM